MCLFFICQTVHNEPWLLFCMELLSLFCCYNVSFLARHKIRERYPLTLYKVSKGNLFCWVLERWVVPGILETWNLFFGKCLSCIFLFMLYQTDSMALVLLCLRQIRCLMVLGDEQQSKYFRCFKLSCITLPDMGYSPGCNRGYRLIFYDCTCLLLFSDWSSATTLIRPKSYIRLTFI